MAGQAWGGRPPRIGYRLSHLCRSVQLCRLHRAASPLCARSGAAAADSRAGHADLGGGRGAHGGGRQPSRTDQILAAPDQGLGKQGLEPSVGSA